MQRFMQKKIGKITCGTEITKKHSQQVSQPYFLISLNMPFKDKIPTQSLVQTPHLYLV